MGRLAPPGSPKTQSVPSRSRAAISLSAPRIVRVVLKG
jgi:hypothetical protein